jgi:hypothetical protein
VKAFAARRKEVAEKPAVVSDFGWASALALR